MKHLLILGFILISSKSFACKVDLNSVSESKLPKIAEKIIKINEEMQRTLRSLHGQRLATVAAAQANFWQQQGAQQYAQSQIKEVLIQELCNR